MASTPRKSGRAARLALAVTVALGVGVAGAAAQTGAVPVSALTIAGPPTAVVFIGVDPDAFYEAYEGQNPGQPLDGVTLFASAAPGGPVLARLPLPRPWGSPPDFSDTPSFSFIGVPPGTYYVLLAYGIVAAPPAAGWRRIDIGACAGPPGRTAVTPTVNGTTVTLAFANGVAVGGACPPDYNVVEVGSAPGRSDIPPFISPSALVTATSVPPGDYYIRAYGQNQYGRGPASLETAVRVGAPCLAPLPPANFTYSIGPNRVVTLTWTQPTGAPYTPVTYYDLRLFDAPGGAGLLGFFLLPPATSLTQQAPPGTYHLALHAGGGCGPSASPATLTFTVP
jgi:hypothetical protein